MCVLTTRKVVAFACKSNQLSQRSYVDGNFCSHTERSKQASNGEVSTVVGDYTGSPLVVEFFPFTRDSIQSIFQLARASSECPCT
jgi:hypothetical protein